MANMTDISQARRRFLRHSLILVPLAAAGGTLLSPGAGAEKSPPNGVSAEYIPLWFNPPEWRFLCAACDRLIPEDELGAGAIAEGVPIFIDKQMQQPYGGGMLWYMYPPFADGVPELGYQSSLVPRQTYRLGIIAVNHYCQQTYDTDFADLAGTEQDRVLQQLERGELDINFVPPQVFFEQLLENTREGYFADPQHGGNQTLASWTLIGFPGARADYQEQMDRPNQPYRLPPVSISGRRGV